MIGRSRSLLLVLAGMVSFPVAVRAQDARVVIANYSNGRILDIRFDPPGHTVLNTDAGSRVGLVSLAFRDDGAAGVHLFAADRQRGQVVFYTNSVGQGAIVLDRATATNPPYPDGLSLDAHHNLYGTTSEIGMGADKDARVWVIRRDPACTGGCLPGGYAPTVGTIDGTVEITVPISGVPTLLTVELLAESRVVPFNAGTLTAGDLLVLASDPPALLRYPAPAVQAFLDQLAQGGTPAEIEPEVFIFPSTADVSPERRFPAGAEPNGMDFTSQGNLLVSAGNGTILIYRPDGTRLSNGGGFVDFASGLGQGKFKLVVGPQNGAFHAFVSDRNGGELLRFRIEADGTGTLNGVVGDPMFPIGIATTTAHVVETPAGPDVTVQLTNLMHSTVENVVTPGQTSSSVVLFEDPREREVNIPPDQPLHRSLHLSEIRADLPPDAEIPAYVRAFRKDDPVLGPPTFLLILVDTNIHVEGIIDHVVDEETILGYEPDCADPASSGQQRLFWLPSPLEPQSLESPRFIDISTDCGTSRGRMRTFSLFLASARDTRPTFDIAKTKLQALSLVLDQALCIDSSLKLQLRDKLNKVIRFLSLRLVSVTISELNAFSALIQASPGAFSNCLVNEGGELRARADSAVFIIQKLPERAIQGAHW